MSSGSKGLKNFENLKSELKAFFKQAQILTDMYHLTKSATLLLNEGIPRALKGKKLRLKNILLLPLIFEEINYF